MKSDKEQAAEFLAQFDALSEEDRRATLGQIFGIDPSKAVVVRRHDGSIELQEVSSQSRAQVDHLASQGFVAATFTNRRARKRAEALARERARREARRKPASPP